MSMGFFHCAIYEPVLWQSDGDYSSMHLEDAAIFIPYGCMVDEFQHIVYENPQMTPAQRHEAWIQLEKEYRPHLDDYTDIFTLKREASGRSSLISMTTRSILLITALLRVCAFQYKIRMDENYQEAGIAT